MIRREEPRPEDLEAIRRALGGMNVDAETPAGKMRFTAHADSGQESPVAVFVATLEDILNRRILTSARAVARRYPTSSGAAEVAIANRAVAFMTAGSRTLHEARARAEDLARESDFELRLLRIPAVDVEALWLRGEEIDLLIPLGEEPMDERRFTDSIMGLAEQRSRFNNRGD